MSTNIFVGNLPFSATEDEIHNLFSAYGTVEKVNLITDRETGQLRGFGFVEMSSGGGEAMGDSTYVCEDAGAVIAYVEARRKR